MWSIRRRRDVAGRKQGDWVAGAADQVIAEGKRRGPDTPLVCASGVSPSGPIHLGNLREIMVPHFVADELRRRGVDCRHILSWDDYDRLRKVPAGYPESFAEYIGRPLTAVPDPCDKHENWAEHFKAPFRDALAQIGVEVTEISQTQMYTSGAYRDQIVHAMRHREQIDTVLGRYRTAKKPDAPDDELLDDEDSDTDAAAVGAEYYPYKPYCSACGRDTTTITSFDEDTTAIRYTCECGSSDGFQLDQEDGGKLVWKVDWPMRWAFEGVTFEAGGVDHSSPGSSFTVGSQLVREVFDGEPPSYLGYSFVGTGGAAKMSGSVGGAPTPGDALQILEAPLLRWLYGRRRPNQAITVAFDQEVNRLYDEWDALVRKVESGEAEPAVAATYARSVGSATRTLPVSERVLPFRALAADGRPLFAQPVRDANDNLVFDQWGPTTGRPAPSESPPAKVPFSTALDVLPLEYATSGTRHVQQVEMIVDHGDGRRGATWSVASEDDGVTFGQVDGVTTLRARFVDESRSLALTLNLRTDTRHDVVEKWARIQNRTEDHTITLPRAFSGAWSIPVGLSARIDYLAGAWGREFEPHRIDLAAGVFSIGSRQGVTGHSFAPMVCVTAPPHGAASSAVTDAYGVSLAWNGSWRLAVEAPPHGAHVRVSAGVDDEDTVVTLEPGESFTTPSTLGTWSPDGPTGVTRNWHAYQRGLARSLDPDQRPVVYNSWYATEFDVHLDHQLRLADVAAQVGAEVFVVDDGWFTGRHSDRAGLGDWSPDPEKFPDGLEPLIDGVLARGMRFGIWVEPEAVNPDSDLYRKHPDWAYHVDGRALTTVRNQLVLDFGRDDVVAWAEEMLRGLLRRYPITYLKWDMNRPVSDGGRPGDPHGRQWSVQHAAGYLRVMRMLRDEFPQVTVEACAGGGGRIDLSVLAVSDVVWPSDETGARDRLRIQDGFLRAYPAHVMSSWVTDERGLRDPLEVSLGYKFVVAMAGVLGIGADILRWNDDERAQARRLVDLYRELRPVIHTGDVTRHGDPREPGYAVEYSDGFRTVVLVYDTNRDRREPVRVHPASLRPGVTYQVRVLGGDGLAECGPVITGASARAAGVVVPWSVAPDADVLVFDPVPDPSEESTP
jgi:alpha-galactosidase